MNKTEFMDESAIQICGMEALNKALGVAGAPRFLTLLSWDPTDYVKLSRSIYDRQSIDEIFENAKKNWK